MEEERGTDQPEEKDSLLEEEEQMATDQPEQDSLLEEEERATDQPEEDSLLEEEQRVADQPEEELIQRQGEFVISVLGEINVTVDPLEVAVCHLHLPEMFLCLFFVLCGWYRWPRKY